MDREQSQTQQNGKGGGEPVQREHTKSAISTGRSGSIGNAINMFNKAEEKPIVPIQRVSKHEKRRFDMKLKYFFYHF